MSWSEGDVDADGLTIHYTRTGDGDQPALVLAHGFSDNGLCWRRVAEVEGRNVKTDRLLRRAHEHYARAIAASPAITTVG